MNKTEHPEGSFMYGIWFVPSVDGDKDWMGKMAIINGKWVFKYRFRYYAGSKDPHDGSDKKNSYAFEAEDASDASRDKMLQTINTVLKEIVKEFGCPVDFVYLNCSPEAPKFLFEIASRPWAHVKRL